MYKNWFWFIKIFCYLVLVILLNRVTGHYDFLIYVFLFFMISINFKSNIMFIFSMAFACLCAIGFALDVQIILIKVIICVFLASFFFLSISSKDKRMLLETIFYSNRKNSKLIKKIYYKKIYNHNKKLLGNNQNLREELNIKTNVTIKNIFIKSKLRYYGFYNRKTNYVKRYLSKEDYFMIIFVFLVSILLFI